MPLPEFTIRHYAGKVTYQVRPAACRPQRPRLRSEAQHGLQTLHPVPSLALLTLG